MTITWITLLPGARRWALLMAGTASPGRPACEAKARWASCHRPLRADMMKDELGRRDNLDAVRPQREGRGVWRHSAQFSVQLRNHFPKHGALMHMCCSLDFNHLYTSHVHMNALCALANLR